MNKSALRRLIKYGIQPLFQPWVPHQLRRLLMNSAKLLRGRSLQQVQHGLQRQRLQLGGRDCYQVSPVTATTLHILYLHGGGYTFGGVATHSQLVDGLALELQATVWMPIYRLAPEHPFPAALNDAIAAYQALLAQGIKAEQMMIAGDSAGGGLTLATALQLREQQQPLPSRLLLLSPWLDLTVSLPSHTERAARDPMLLPQGLRAAAQAYCQTTPTDHPLCSPLFADLTGLPPLTIQVGTDEILYDDAVQLHARASAAGVPSDLQIYDDLWHVFQLHCHQLPEATAAVRALKVDVANRGLGRSPRGQ